MHPTNQCTRISELEPNERCRGLATSELSVTQVCAQCSFMDVNIHRVRCNFRDDICGERIWHPNKYVLAGLPREQWAAQRQLEEARKEEEWDRTRRQYAARQQMITEHEDAYWRAEQDEAERWATQQQMGRLERARRRRRTR